MYHQLGARGSVLVSEYSVDPTEGQEPYYPFPTQENKAHFEKYRALAVREEKERSVFFVGRLANYKYFNMDDAIDNTLQIYSRIEGEQAVNTAVAQGRARAQSSAARHAHAVVALHLPALAPRLVDQAARRVAALCATLRVAPNYKLFVMLSGEPAPGFLASLESEWQNAGCAPLEPGLSLVVRSLGTARPAPALFLYEHLVAGAFWFGDSTLFVDLSDRDLDAQQSAAALRVQARVFDDKRSRASQPDVLATNIRTMADAANLDHVLALSPLEAASPEPCGKRVRDADVVVTDAALRRMLSVHRTWIYDTLLPRLRAGSGLRPAEGLERLYCLFFD
jgi:hypothetical protein